ncbi:MAG: Fic family protein [Candidatus Micrarchaeota archaeon]
MAYIKKQVVDGRVYYLLVESKREGSKVVQHVLKRFEGAKEMLEYCKRHRIKAPNVDLIEKQIVEKIEKKLARLNTLRPLPKQTLESLKKKFEVEMTYNSNAIEGNRLTLKETYLVLERGMTIGGRSMREHLEATNHRDAISTMENMVKKGKRITEADVLMLHAVILDKINPEWAGFYRNGPVAITLAKHRPPSYKEISEKMKEIVALLNEDSKGIKAVEAAAAIHHKLVYLHPFWDGNGRLARLLMNIKLMRAGFPPTVLRKKERTSYYNALEKADEGELGPLTTMIAKDVERALELYLKTIEE